MDVHEQKHVGHGEEEDSVACTKINQEGSYMNDPEESSLTRLVQRSKRANLFRAYERNKDRYSGATLDGFKRR